MNITTTELELTSIETLLLGVVLRGYVPEGPKLVNGRITFTATLEDRTVHASHDSSMLRAALELAKACGVGVD